MLFRSAWALALLLSIACERNPVPEGRPAPQGLPPSAAPAPGGSNPHGGAAMGTSHPGGAAPMDSVHGGGGDMRTPTPPPLDPQKVVEGTIQVAPALAAEVKQGDVIFLVARRVDPGTGEVVRMPVAVDRVEVGALPVPFRLSNQNVMMAGTEFTGKVQITARVDRDGEAMSRKPGDLEGTLEATIPASGLELVLDKKIP
jgi:cytochrome c-type biogenesis protein CcmH